MLQLVEEHKALWCIRKMYKKDAATCKTCTAFWSKLERDKMATVKALQNLVKKHIK
jgi:hypothetical protein